MSNKKYYKNHKQYKNKFFNKNCDNNMSYEECELAILRNAIEETENLKGQKIVNNAEIQKIIIIVEDFIIHKKLVCYGGSAINNILPKYSQFYNKEIELPDYDFYSANALDDAKELADIYYAAGYKDVEAKAGVHKGTFKVFVNFIAIADITYINKELYDSILKESILIAGIHYAPPDFLRMSMYLELSRPAGDVSRWEKVLKRLNLLNEHYPMKIGDNCEKIDFTPPCQEASGPRCNKKHNIDKRLYYITRDNLIDQGVIFFGAYAMSLYSEYMSSSEKEYVKKMSNFDVICENPERCALILKEQLEREHFTKIKTIVHPAVGELIPEHIELFVNDKSLVVIYKPVACHNYNKIIDGNKEINIASIDTILSFYLAFLYSDMTHYNKDRLSCMAKFLFQIQQKNRIEQRGILKRFSIDCYGKQPTLDTMRSEKAEKYKELSSNRNNREYEMWFLKYIPDKVQFRSDYSKIISEKFKKAAKSIDEKSRQLEYEQREPTTKSIESSLQENSNLIKTKEHEQSSEKSEKSEKSELETKKLFAKNKRLKTMKNQKKQLNISNFMEKFRAKRKSQTKKYYNIF